MDIIEIPRGKPKYMNKVFNVANHWKATGGSESLQFHDKGTPPSTSFVDVTSSEYQTYGIEWSKGSMKCSVNGKVFYTFTENIPTDPVDMMMLLTLEFKPDSPKMREMSRVLVDYVRVYQKK